LYTVYQNGEYIIGKAVDGYVVVNTKGEYENHSHFKYSLSAARRCIELVKKKTIPKYSLYMITACKRISIDPIYNAKLDLYLLNHKQKLKCRKKISFAR